MPGRDQQGNLRSTILHSPQPTAQQLFSLSPYKDGLLNFLCETRCDEELLESTLGSTRLYIGGGFKYETNSVGPTLYNW